MPIILLIAIAYLVGSLPIGLFVGMLVAGIDIRDFGSGNIGASNVGRILGKTWGTIVFAFDVTKGLAPVLVARHFPSLGGWTPVLVGIAAIMGHNASIFLKFRGGKGVATSLGVAFGLSWVAGLIAFVSWVVCVAVTQYISVASLVAVPIGSVLIWWFNGQKLSYGLFGILATVFVFVKHKANLSRLSAGEEPKVALPWTPKAKVPTE